MEGFQVCFSGGIQIEKRLNELLVADNTGMIKKLEALKESA